MPTSIQRLRLTKLEVYEDRFGRNRKRAWVQCIACDEKTRWVSLPVHVPELLKQFAITCNEHTCEGSDQ